MPDLAALCLDAHDPRRLAAFWAGVLGWEVSDRRDGDALRLLPSDDTGFEIRCLPGAQPKTGPNRLHST